MLSKKQIEWWTTGFSSEAQAVIDLMITVPPGNVKVLMAALVDSQVLSGNFPLIDFWQFPNMDTAPNAVINWIGNYSNGLLVNSPVHDPFNGITGDGINQLIDTQYNPSVDSTVGVGQDDLQVGVWCVDNLDATTADLFGAIGGVDLKMRQRVGPDFQLRMNGTVNNSTGSTLFLDNKMYSLRRTTGANYDFIVDKVITNIVRASSGLVSDDVEVLADGNASLHLNAKVAMQYACKPTGFDHDNFFDNVKIFIDAMALLG